LARIGYNERSWAIDLISETNLFLAGKKRKVRSAGGENTVTAEDGRLFPDVLLYGDEAKGELLQGWELKFPDTSISDSEFIENATLKADLLSLDSFLLWNVREAVLYRKEKDGDFKPFKVWNPISEISKREDVKRNEEKWKARLIEIIEDLCDFFDSGELKEKTIVEALSLNSIIDIILENTSGTADNIRAAVVENGRLDAGINTWWRSSANEYTDNDDRYVVLARVVLTDWVIKVVFAHILKRYFDDAKQISSLTEDTTAEDGLTVMEAISEGCNFWNIFSTNIGQVQVSSKKWNQLMQLNGFLAELNIAGIDIELLHDVLQSSVVAAKRKGAGQYSTPQKLSELLVRITIDNKTKPVLDPCCGTGTIIGEAYNLKKEYGVSEADAIEDIWASDKYAFPLQLAMLALTKPENVGRILQIFRHDVVQLKAGMSITFKDPTTGKNVDKQLPKLDYIVSNLPFVQQEDVRYLNPDIYQSMNGLLSRLVMMQSCPVGVIYMFSYRFISINY